MSVTVVTCVYGDYARFVPAWLSAVRALDPAPDEIIVATDQPLGLPADILAVMSACDWDHPQAFHLNEAVLAARSEWVLIADADDLLVPDALAGLDDVAADVWQMGFHRSDGETYIPPTLTGPQFLASDRNVFVAASAVRRQALIDVGGFQDVAYQDWALWRALARAGRSFESARKVAFLYMRHADARGETELTADHRQAHVDEMYALEFDMAVERGRRRDHA